MPMRSSQGATGLGRIGLRFLVSTVGRCANTNAINPVTPSLLRRSSSLCGRLFATCHPEHIRSAQCKLREGSGSSETQILRFAQNDTSLNAFVLVSPWCKAQFHLVGQDSQCLLCETFPLLSVVDEGVAEKPGLTLESLSGVPRVFHEGDLLGQEPG